MALIHPALVADPFDINMQLTVVAEIDGRVLLVDVSGLDGSSRK